MILEQLNRATGPVEVLLPLKGLRSFVQPGEPLHDPEVEEAIFDEFRQGLRPDTPRFELDICLMDPEFSECAADRMLQLLRGSEAAAPGGTLGAEFATACAGNIFPRLEGPALMAAKATDASFCDSDASAATVAHVAGQPVDGSITAITDEPATLRQAVQTLADTVRHHDAQLRRLTRD